MTRLIACLAHLPKIRQALLTLVLVAGTFDMVAAIVLLAYQLALTVSFQHVVPSIVVTSFLCAAFPLWFLYSRPYAIRLPGKDDPAVGSKRDTLAKFSRSIAAELICLAGTGVWVLISVSTLHAETPGLMYHCGGYAICRMLLCVFALTWICFFFLCLAFATLLVSTLYFIFRRSSPFPILIKSFLAIDWERYSGRPVNRAATVKRVRKGGKGADGSGATGAVAGAPRTLEGDEQADGRLKRDDSCAPVLPFASSAHGYGYGHGRTDSGLGASVRSGAGTLDWDVQSTFTTGTGTGTRPTTMFGAYAVGPESEPGTPRREDQVFVLQMEDEGRPVDEDAAEPAKEEGKEAKGVGAAI
ncbi:hypothetical protein JCM3770_000404 [Rhodotorula araucariae]